MRVLILGGSGMLGHKLVQVLGQYFEVFTTIRRPFESVNRFGIFERERTIAKVDVTTADELSRVVATARPDVVINAIGIIKQVPEAHNSGVMSLINSKLPFRLYDLAESFGFRLICISTDCVFSGKKGSYNEHDVPDASDAYGQSKHHGEVVAGNCLTIRTSIIGRELETSHSLLEWFLSNRGGKVCGYTRSIYSGFPTNIFAEIVGDLISNHPGLSGVFHVSSDPINKFDLLRLFNEAYEASIEIVPDDSLVINRSLDSSKFRTATGFSPSPWPDMIARMASDPTPYDHFRGDA